MSTRTAIYAITGNGFSALSVGFCTLRHQTPDWSRQHLDAQIERGTRRSITDRQHLSPETYGLVKDKAREEVLQGLERNTELTRAILDETSLMKPAEIETLRGVLLLQREIQAHKLDPRGYGPPGSRKLDETLVEGPDVQPWPLINETRSGAERVLTVASNLGMDMNDDRKGYEAGRNLFPALADRMHLTAVLAKCSEFCARVEAFVKNAIGHWQGIDPKNDQDKLWPFNARDAVERNETNLGLRAPTVQVEQEREPSHRSSHRERGDDFGL